MINNPEYREYIKLENLAHDKLIKHGYTPQGRTRNFKQVVVFKIKNRESKEVFYFKNWQEAAENLCI